MVFLPLSGHFQTLPFAARAPKSEAGYFLSTRAATTPQFPRAEAHYVAALSFSLMLPPKPFRFYLKLGGCAQVLAAGAAGLCEESTGAASCGAPPFPEDSRTFQGALPFPEGSRTFQATQ